MHSSPETSEYRYLLDIVQVQKVLSNLYTQLPSTNGVSVTVPPPLPCLQGCTFHVTSIHSASDTCHSTQGDFLNSFLAQALSLQSQLSRSEGKKAVVRPRRAKDAQ